MNWLSTETATFYIYFASSLLLSILGGNYCVGMEMAIVGEAIEDVFMYNLLFFCG